MFGGKTYVSLKVGSLNMFENIINKILKNVINKNVINNNI